MDTKLRFLRDGADRLIIVVDGADMDTQEAIIGRVSSAIINPAKVESALPTSPEEITGLQPIQQVVEPGLKEEDLEKMQPVEIGRPYKGVLLSDGEYKGKTPFEALGEHGYSALGILFKRACELEKNSSERKSITTDCKKYMANGLRRDTQTIRDTEGRKKFIDTMATMAPVDELAQKYGFSSYKDLCKLGTPLEVNNMFEAVVLSIEARGRG